MTDAPDSGSTTTQYEVEDGAPPPDFDLEPDIRYSESELLGEGGMGRVALVRDAKLDRDVALKSIRADRQQVASMTSRFVREARLQARLQHPSILPVYDIGLDDNRGPYFTMRPISGESLADALERRPSPAQRRELLAGLSRVALAVDYAHRKDVIHCDLKPRNIILGSFGEVYVGDWGAAHDLTEPDQQRARQLAGSPAYMAPEQAEGRSHLIGPPTDVFALGAILFEIVSGRGFASSLVDSRLGEDALKSVPGALAVICLRATVPEQSRRFSTAREFHAALQAFLDGELDSERRAEESARLAGEAKLRVQSLTVDADQVETRHRIIQAVGRALALDPKNPLAIEALLEVIETPMTVEPPEVEALAAEADVDRMRRLGKIASLAYVGQLLHLPLFLSLDVLQPAYLWGFYICMALAAAVAYWTHLRPSESKVLLCLAISAVGTSMLTGLMGPLLLMPMFGIVNAATFALILSGRRMLYPAAIGAASIAIPYALSRLGILPNVYDFTGDEIAIAATAVSLGSGAEAFLVGANALTLLFGAIVIGLLSRRLRGAERRSFVQTWHFRQLLPTSSGGQET